MKLRISNFKFQIAPRAVAGKNLQFAIHHSQFARAYTLIEIMVVVAIIGLVAAMGLPAILKAVQKEGMRKALNDVTQVCESARAKAIFQNQNVAVVFHPVARTFGVDGGGPAGGGLLVNASTLPDGVELAMLDINQEDYGASDPARVWFYPNGTSDEMTVVLHDRDDWRKITLELTTGLATVSDVDK